MTPGDPELEFQAALLLALHEAAGVDDVLAHLRADARTEPFREYVDAMDRRMIEVAIVITRRWAVRA